MLSKLGKEFEIEDVIEQDAELKKRLLKEMHVISQRETKKHNRRLSQFPLQ